MGVDMTFLEAPESIDQMEEYNRRVGGATLANMLEQGSTPVLPPQELKKLGYTMAAYPLTLLSASIRAMNESLERIKNGDPTDDMILSCKYWLVYLPAFFHFQKRHGISPNPSILLGSLLLVQSRKLRTPLASQSMHKKRIGINQIRLESFLVFTFGKSVCISIRINYILLCTIQETSANRPKNQ